MELNFLQNEIKGWGEKMGIRPQTSVEIMLGVTEETGEVAKEVALFEKTGNKVNWKRLPDKDLLAEEIAQLLVNIFSLASHYDINIEKAMQNLFDGKKE